MAKLRAMTEELHIGEVDDEELRLVLQTVLPRCAQFRPDEVEYRTMADEWALTLQYGQGKIVRAVAGPAMTSEIEHRARTAIEQALLTSASRAVCRWTLFSGRAVEGCWRYRDQFQIVPAPPEAPRPTVLMADHPFVLDFVFEDSAEGRIRQLRYIRRAADLTLVLNLLLRSRISSPSMRPRHHWVLVWPAEHPQPDTVWAQEGYWIPGFKFLVEDFPDVADVPSLGEVAAETYYDLWAGSSDYLTIPAELASLLDTFSGLNGDDRERFLRACFWYHIASTVWDYSQSLYVTSLVNAVECLASLGPERSTSEEPKPSGLFVSFMRKFAPGGPGAKALDKIYEARSEISHGERLLLLDSSARSIGLSQTSARDREIADNATVLCRGALINWLWSRNSATSGPLLAKGLRPAKRTRPGTKSGVTIIIPGMES
jgi:hypothetical protein